MNLKNLYLVDLLCGEVHMDMRMHVEVEKNKKF